MHFRFQAPIQLIQSHSIILLPNEISQVLPSRGMLMARVSFLKEEFITPLEPDGKKSHWFELDVTILKQRKLPPHKPIDIEIETIDDWPEPIIPNDLMEILATKDLFTAWENLTVKAHWDWIRWIRFTKNPDTRKKRIQVTCSKLQKGDKRPCCFDRTRCTVTDVAKSGVLMNHPS